MYIPNPQKWVKYYESMAKGHQNPFVDQRGGRMKQIGGSLSGSQGSFMVTIEEASKSVNSHPSNCMKVELVSPSQQVVEQAKSELQVGRKGIKRKNASQFVSSEKRRRTVNTSQRRKQTLAKPKTRNVHQSKGKKTSRKSKPKRTAKGKKTTKPKKTATRKKPKKTPTKLKKMVVKDIFTEHGST